MCAARVNADDYGEAGFRNTIVPSTLVLRLPALMLLLFGAAFKTACRERIEQQNSTKLRQGPKKS